MTYKTAALGAKATLRAQAPKVRFPPEADIVRLAGIAARSAFELRKYPHETPAALAFPL